MDKLSIYVIEKHYDTFPTGELHCHCFLALCDESEGMLENARMLEQLHFLEKNDMMDTTTPKMIHEHRGEGHFKNCSVYPLVSGLEEDIRQMWSHALALGKKIDQSSVYFGFDYIMVPHAVNCRSATRDAVEVMGLNFNDEFSNAATNREYAPGITASSILNTIKDITPIEHHVPQPSLQTL